MTSQYRWHVCAMWHQPQREQQHSQLAAVVQMRRYVDRRAPHYSSQSSTVWKPARETLCGCCINQWTMFSQTTKMGKKQLNEIVLISTRIVNSLSRITPRWLTDSGGSTATEHRLRLMTSSCLRFTKLALEPNQISSVLSGFSCNRREEHQSRRLSTHVSSRRRCSVTTLIFIYSYLIM